MTHSPKSSLPSFSAFVEAVASTLGLPPLQPWQKAFLAKVEGRRRLDRFARYEPERNGAAEPQDWPVDWVAPDWARGGRVGPGRPMILGLDLGREYSSGIVGRHGSDGRIIIDHVLPLEPVRNFHAVTTAEKAARMRDAQLDRHRRDSLDAIALAFAIPPRLIMNAPPGSPARRLQAMHDLIRLQEETSIRVMTESVKRWSKGLELRLSVDSRAASRAFRKLAHKVDLMRYREADRRKAGSGAIQLQGRIYNAFFERQAAFGDPWKEAAAEYSRLQDMHEELYGERWPRPTPDQEAPF